MLFFIDFDQTIVNGHFHNSLMSKFRTKPGSINNSIFITELLNDPNTGPKNPDQMRDFIRSALQNGHKICITSFTQFPEVFKSTLQKIGLTEDEISKIGLVYGLPKNQSQGKQDHINAAMRTNNITDKRQVCLIDDDENNCNLARANGMQAITVPKQVNAAPTYLNEAHALSQQQTHSSAASAQSNSSSSLSNTNNNQGIEQAANQLGATSLTRYKINLDKQMITLQNLAGTDQSSAFKQSVFRWLQNQNLIEAGADIRSIQGYNPGQTFITVEEPMTFDQQTALKEFIKQQYEQVLHNLPITNTLNINSYLGNITLALGRESASNLKRDLFQKLQQDGFINPIQGDIGLTTQYSKGQPYIKTDKAMTGIEAAKYLEFAQRLESQALRNAHSNNANNKQQNHR